MSHVVVRQRANIGAGTITANYDGFAKHRTRIGAGASIGSNSVLVAPVSVGDGAVAGTSSTITKDVSPDALALERGEQRERAGGGRRFRERRDQPPEVEAESADDAKENENEI